ncbi:hypothetical protein CCP2SC5_20044 [Azospirillaceae bacterium]
MSAYGSLRRLLVSFLMFFKGIRFCLGLFGEVSGASIRRDSNSLTAASLLRSTDLDFDGLTRWFSLEALMFFGTGL